MVNADGMNTENTESGTGPSAAIPGIVDQDEIHSHVEERSMKGIPWSHLVPVPERYKQVGRRVEETYLRVVTIKMLEDLAKLIKKVLSKGYKITDEHNGGIAVTMETINLYHIDEHFVKPLTEQHQCSFAELAWDKEYAMGSVPYFFVSHWWGTPLIDTIRMTKLHEVNCHFEPCNCRKIFSDEYAVWICAFSIRQNNLTKEKIDTQNYLETPFARALMSSNCYGTVLLLNETSAQALERSWCIFEAYIALTHGKDKAKQHRMDILTIIPEGHFKGMKNKRCAGLLKDFTESDSFDYIESSIWLTKKRSDLVDQEDIALDGIILDEMIMNENFWGPDPDLAWFPSDLCLRGLHVNILEAKASKKADQERISSWIEDLVDPINTALQRKFLPPALAAACNACDPDVLRTVVERALSHSLVNSREELARKAHRMNLAMAIKSTSNEMAAIECLEILIELGYDVNKPTFVMERLGRTLLGMALTNKDYDRARVLLKAGADPTLLRWMDFISNDYNVPEDILDVLWENGLLTKFKCMRFCYWGSCCCVCCWYICSFSLKRRQIQDHGC